MLTPTVLSFHKCSLCSLYHLIFFLKANSPALSFSIAIPSRSLQRPASCWPINIGPGMSKELPFSRNGICPSLSSHTSLSMATWKTCSDFCKLPKPWFHLLTPAANPSGHVLVLGPLCLPPRICQSMLSLPNANLVSLTYSSSTFGLLAHHAI